MGLLKACEAGAWPVIEHYFHDCVYSSKEFVGFCLGTTAILLWITAQVPQFVDNIKNQSAEALSVWFLAQWFLGDTLNLLGCLMSGEQLPTTTALAMYFVLSDVAMLTQYVYFGALQRRKQLLEQKAQARRARRSLTTVPGSHHHHHPHHRHQRNRASGAVNLISDNYERPQLSKAFAASFSHNTQNSNGSLFLLQQAAKAQRQQLAPQLEEADEAADAAADTVGAAAQPATAGGGIPQGAVVATAAAGSLLSLVALGLAASQRQGGLSAGSDSWSQSRGALSLWGGGSGGGLAYGSTGVSGHKGGHDKPWWTDPDEILKVLGAVCGSASTMLYLSSRVSQIYKNWSRKSAEGLSVMMFIFTICANLCTGFSILLRAENLGAFEAQLPWVLGAFGTVGLDVFIARQAIVYNRSNHPPAHQDAETGTAHGVPASAATPNPLLQPLIPE